MKIIDEKGRIFGKINIIDALVIIFFLCLTPMFYFGHKILNKKPIPAIEQQPSPESEKKFIEIEIDCQFLRLTSETIRLISPGDKELNKKGQVIGEIKSVSKSTPYIHQIDIGSGYIFFKEDALLKQALVVLKIYAELKGDKVLYKGKRILMNGTINFDTSKYQVEGKVLFESVPNIVKTKLIE